MIIPNARLILTISYWVRFNIFITYSIITLFSVYSLSLSPYTRITGTRDLVKFAIYHNSIAYLLTCLSHTAMIHQQDTYFI